METIDLERKGREREGSEEGKKEEGVRGRRRNDDRKGKREGGGWVIPCSHQLVWWCCIPERVPVSALPENIPSYQISVGSP